MSHPREHDDATSITTGLSRSWGLRNAIIGLACIVLGIWGGYDYLVDIPTREKQFARGRVCVLVKQVLETSTPEGDPARLAAAVEAIQEALSHPDLQAAGEAIRAVLESGLPPPPPPEPGTVDFLDDEDWFIVLQLFGAGVSRSRPVADLSRFPIASRAYQFAERGNSLLGHFTPPGKYDRPIQWMFILCLPFAPYYAWVLLRSSRRRYTLDAEGTLESPDGTWAADDIATIEMDRWMAKSIARVVHIDGRRAVLDAYVHRDLDRIVGRLASRFHPEDWGEDARRLVKPPDDSDASDAS